MESEPTQGVFGPQSQRHLKNFLGRVKERNKPLRMASPNESAYLYDALPDISPHLYPKGLRALQGLLWSKEVGEGYIVSSLISLGSGSNHQSCCCSSPIRPKPVSG
ncbi:hypothetical protein GOP47_0007863, partial [Adiantum capillus-veneris]